MGPQVETSPFRSSTNRINELLCRDLTQAYNIPHTAFTSLLSERQTLNQVANKIENYENPISIVKSAYHHLDDISAKKFATQLNMLEIKWQNNVNFQKEIGKTHHQLESDHLDKHRQILADIDSEPNAANILSKIQSSSSDETLQTTRTMDATLTSKVNQWKNDRNRLRNSVASLANETRNCEQEQIALRAQLESLYRNILSSGIPNTILSKLPEPHTITTPSRQFK